VSAKPIATISGHLSRSVTAIVDKHFSTEENGESFEKPWWAHKDSNLGPAD
jgi:hypothetical protein